MTLGEIRKLLFALLNKDQSGNSFTPESYNLEIQSKNLDLFNVEYEKLKQLAQAKGNPIYNEFANSSSLRILKRQVTKALNPVGVLLKSDLADFGYMLTGTVGGGVTKPASVFKRIDFVDNAEGNKRRVNAFEKPIDQFPIGIEFYNKYNLYPNDIAKVNIDYIKIPSTPYYDYCIRDDNDREEYMPVGSIIKADNKLYDENDNVLLSSQTVTHVGTILKPYTSLSVEFEWESFMHIKLISMILTDMGVTIRDAEILKYGMAEEQKQQV